MKKIIQLFKQLFCSHKTESNRMVTNGGFSTHQVYGYEAVFCDICDKKLSPIKKLNEK